MFSVTQLFDALNYKHLYKKNTFLVSSFLQASQAFARTGQLKEVKFLLITLYSHILLVLPYSLISGSLI